MSKLHYTAAQAAHIKAMRDETDKLLSETVIYDLSTTPPEKLLGPLVSLIETLESAIKIAYARHYLNHPEPFENACKQVLEQSLRAIQLGRANKMLPKRED